MRRILIVGAFLRGGAGIRRSLAYLTRDPVGDDHNAIDGSGRSRKEEPDALIEPSEKRLASEIHHVAAEGPAVGRNEIRVRGTDTNSQSRRFYIVFCVDHIDLASVKVNHELAGGPLPPALRISSGGR